MKKGSKKMSATPVPPRGPKKKGTGKGSGKNPLGYSTSGKK